MDKHSMADPPDQLRRSRLETLKEQSVEPFYKGNTHGNLHIYWLPVTGWPPDHRQREWLLKCFGLFVDLAMQRMGVIPMQFLQMETVNGPIRERFLTTAFDTTPVMGVCNRPGKAPAQIPSPDEIDAASHGRATPPPPEHYMRDYVYWLIKPNHEEQRASFQAYGGMTILLAKADEKNKLEVPRFPAYVMEHPKIREMFDPVKLDAQIRALSMLKGEFATKSKELYAQAFADRPEYRGILYAIPVWNSSDFFRASPLDLSNLFSITRIYIRECPEEKGMIVASQDDIRPLLIEVLAKAGEPPNSLRQRI